MDFKVLYCKRVVLTLEKMFTVISRVITHLWVVTYPPFRQKIDYVKSTESTSTFGKWKSGASQFAKNTLPNTCISSSFFLSVTLLSLLLPVVLLPFYTQCVTTSQSRRKWLLNGTRIMEWCFLAMQAVGFTDSKKFFVNLASKITFCDKSWVYLLSSHTRCKEKNADFSAFLNFLLFGHWDMARPTFSTNFRGRGGG